MLSKSVATLLSIMQFNYTFSERYRTSDVLAKSMAVLSSTLCRSRYWLDNSGSTFNRFLRFAGAM